MTHGTNIEVEFKGDKMVITIDISKEHGTSSTGKSTTIATSHGNQAIALPGNKGQISLGINCYKKKA